MTAFVVQIRAFIFWALLCGHFAVALPFAALAQSSSVPEVTANVVKGDVQEGTQARFRISLSAIQQNAVSVNYMISGSASAGTDFTGSVTGSLTFSPGETVKYVDIETVLDSETDDSETLVLSLSVDDGSARIGTRTAQIHIRDLALSVIDIVPGQPWLVFEGEQLYIHVRSNYPALKDYTLDATITDDTATGGYARGQGIDFSIPSGAMLRKGENGTIIAMDVFRDDLDEPIENFTIALNHPEGLFGSVQGFSRTVRIFDQDPILISLSSVTDTIKESGGRTSITLSLSRPLGSFEELGVGLDFSEGISGIGRDFELRVPNVPPKNIRLVDFNSMDLSKDTPTVIFGPGTTRSVSFDLVAIDDVINEGVHETVSIRIDSSAGGVRSDNDFVQRFAGGWKISGNNQPINIKIIDDDHGGLPEREDLRAIKIIQSGGETLMLEGETDTYDVVLTEQPNGDVEIDISLLDNEFGTFDLGKTVKAIGVSPGSLTFTRQNWDQPQTVTVTSSKDRLVDQSVNRRVLKPIIRHTPSGGGYERVWIEDVFVEVHNNEEYAVTISESDGTTAVGEDGTTDTYNVALTLPPLSSDVVIDIVSSNSSAVTVSPQRLVFTRNDRRVRGRRALL